MLRSASLAVLAGVIGLSGLAQAKSARPSAAFLQQRMVRLKQTARTLNEAGLPGYAVKYTRRGRSVRPEDRSGAMLVTAIDSRNINTWNDKVGRRSVGFMTSAGVCSTGGSSGFVRVGNEYMDYNWVRGGGTKTPITNKTSCLTEATFLVSGPELAAFKAFYYARNAKLIKNGKGRVIDPGWVNPGKSDLKTEGCAGAASSGLNGAWVRYFQRNLPAIKAYGQQHNIPELANAPDNAAQLLKGFIDRAGAKQQTDPRVLVRHHAPAADMITVFNQGFTQNPIQELKWNRQVTWYTSYSSGRRYHDRRYPSWNGMGYNHTIFDLAPGEKATKSWSANRMSLASFAESL